MKPRRVAVVAASPLVASGIVAALADDSSLRIDAPVREVEAIDDGAGPPDAVVAVASGADEARGLQAAFGGRVALVLLGAGGLPMPTGDAAALASLPSDASPTQLRAALQAVLAGLHAWSTSIAPPATSGALATPRHADDPPGEPLTPRELEVYELMAKGLSNRDIAGVLGISAHTAKFHVAQILAKLGAATRAEAVAIGLKLGLIGV